MDNKVEILAGDNIKNAFKSLGIEANCTYKRSMPPEDGHYHGEEYEVWEISKEALTMMSEIDDKEWKDDWGFWRYAEGSNLAGEPTHQFTINNQSILAWYSQDKLDAYLEDFLEPAYIEEFESENAAREELIRDYWDEKCKYKNFYQYCSEQWGASTERNVCAIAVDISRMNNMTMGELLSKVG